MRYWRDRSSVAYESFGVFDVMVPVESEWNKSSLPRSHRDPEMTPARNVATGFLDMPHLRLPRTDVMVSFRGYLWLANRLVLHK